MENKYKVPKKSWESWPYISKQVFNTVYEDSYNNQLFMIHPKSSTVPQKEWSTTAWNHAWIAADCVREYMNESKDT